MNIPFTSAVRRVAVRQVSRDVASFLKRSKQFYGETLGWQLNFSFTDPDGYPWSYGQPN